MGLWLLYKYRNDEVIFARRCFPEVYSILTRLFNKVSTAEPPYTIFGVLTNFSVRYPNHGILLRAVPIKSMGVGKMAVAIFSYWWLLMSIFNIHVLLVLDKIQFFGWLVGYQPSLS